MKKLIFVFTFILLVTMLSAGASIVGSMQSWDPADPAYDLSENANGVWVLTKTISAGNYTYKVVEGDSWGDPNYPSDQPLDLTADTSVTWKVNLDGDLVFDSEHPPIVAGDFQSELGGTDWDQTSTTTLMVDDGTNGDDIAGDDIYTYQAVIPAGSYQGKVVLNNNWDQNTGGNLAFDSDGTNPSKFTYDMSNNTTTVPTGGLSQEVTVTFQVYMGNEDAASYSGGVSVQGATTPLDWSEGSTTMDDPEADMIYSVDVVFPAGTNPELEYKYVKNDGSTWTWEDYLGMANRTLNIDDSSPTMIIDPPQIFNSDDTLPVELSAFTAVFAGSTPTIYWTTQSETNNSGWNLYRSQTEDYSQAMNINNELIAGAGTTSQPTNYTYDDEYPVQAGQTYWYWLESVENNGTTDNYGPITLNIPCEGGDEQLPQLTKLVGNHPNPFNPETTIEFQIKEGQTGKLTIYNSKGQVIEATTVTPQDNNYTWKGDKYGSGIYFYKLETEYFSQIKKMIMLK